ncbi:hypothetical protein EYF80_060562 [Liparis tanakae]|uniref:Uncharacterized protein n=1 Tax=Liparis tanakae TaxID=230148 RepID=A0A4Z2EL42_9TELE|nr:hypothetical protein EYF80_060562 [Liparis tanakae]
MAGAQGDSSDSILSLKEILSVGVTMKAHWQQDNQDLLEQRSVANPSITIGRSRLANRSSVMDIFPSGGKCRISCNTSW